MKIQDIRKAFTLIELLVVITIIGILATGATSVYTSQIQKSRDTTRINSLKTLVSAVEQSYQDTSEYPRSNSFSGSIKNYLDKLPKDPKERQACNGDTTCAFVYGVSSDINGIQYAEYEVSLGFENASNKETKAGSDSGNDSNRLEQGINVSGTGHITSSTGAISASGAIGCKKALPTALGIPSDTDSIYVSSDGC